jgi:uncharacterized membrane protein YvbJ
MQCPKCGWNNPDDAAQCANCQADLTQPAQPQPVQQAPQAVRGAANYMTWSIIVTVVGALCCNPASLVLGIIAIVKSSAANSKANAGDQAGAFGDANTAKILCIIGTVLLALWALLYIPFVIGAIYSFYDQAPYQRGF